MKVKFLENIELNNSQYKRKEIVHKDTICDVINETEDFLQVELSSKWTTMMPKSVLGKYAIIVEE